jgi:hypothetical protein
LRKNRRKRHGNERKNDVGHDAENLRLLDSLLISANQQLTSPEVAQKWRK